MKGHTHNSLQAVSYGPCFCRMMQISGLVAYRAPSEDCVLVAVAFLGCFQAHNIQEVVQRLDHGGVSSVESGDLFCRDGLVSSKGLQDAGRQWRINLFIKLQENQADLITVREEPITAGVRDLFD